VHLNRRWQRPPCCTMTGRPGWQLLRPSRETSSGTIWGSNPAPSLPLAASHPSQKAVQGALGLFRAF
jgi:hypothetical protein